MFSKRKPIYSFVGLPASGKGTQIDKLSKEYHLEIVSIGELVRQKIEEGNKNDPDIIDMKKHYNEGIPQKDSVVFEIISDKLQKMHRGVIFDNFPFSERQLDFLRGFAAEKKWEKPVLIWIKIAPKTSIDRILSRKVCTECDRVYKQKDLEICPKCGGKLITRKDDHKSVVETRIQHYQPRIRHLVEHFKTHNRVIEVDGEPSINEVYNQIKKTLH